MATVNDVATEHHRSVASRIKHLERMPAEEARHRAAYVANMEEKAPASGEGRSLVMGHAARLLAALPVKEYLDRLASLHELANEMQGSDASDVQSAITEVKSQNAYIPGLVAACDARLMGEVPAWDECDLNEVLGIAQKSSPAKRESALDAAIRKATSQLKEKEDALRAELYAYEAQVIKDYRAANIPVPAHLRAAERRMNEPKAEKLRQAAAEYRRIADDINEPELARYYMAKSAEAEAKAEALKEGV